jgi:hypothetical protein
MTFDEAVEIGKKQLVAYAPRLESRVRGTKPYDGLRAKRASHLHVGALSAAKPDAIEQLVRDLLEDLARLTDGFWASEPPNSDSPADRKPGYQMRTVRHEDLSLTFAAEHDVMNDAWGLRVSCWYQQ